MRRVILALLCLFLLTTTVSAAGTVTSLQSTTQVDTDGGCSVTLTLQLSLDATDTDLTFPLPRTARDVYLNGKAVRSPLRGDYRVVDLTDVVPGAGVYTVTLQYSLPDSVIEDEEGQLLLQFDLLSGFAYPISSMSFTITLPGAPEARPTFFSTYYQETADSLMDLTIRDNTISATVTQPLKDQEALTMSLPVSGEMFPQSVVKRWKMSTNDVLMIVLAILALVYYLAGMSSLPIRRNRKAQEPEGLTAGELGCCLTGQGVDFSMLVVSWAQLGYLLIELQPNGRVLLHKRMEMGNERSEFERHYFKILFGRRTSLDGTGSHYARLSQKAANLNPGIRDYFQRRSGNPNILRLLCLAIGFLSGISLALAFANDTIWQTVLSVLLAPLSTFAAWSIQKGAKALHLRRRQCLWLGLVCSLLWSLLGLWAGEDFLILCVIALQWIFGLAAAYGGRRSEIGRQYMADILGLRHHLRHVSSQQLQFILEQNPDYYYALAPYALALGMDQAFARQMGGQRLSPCTYMDTGDTTKTTAKEWSDQLRQAVKAMDQRQKRLRWERFLGK